eukprot:2553349-Pyramimonas_sp.AAC.2
MTTLQTHKARPNKRSVALLGALSRVYLRFLGLTFRAPCPWGRMLKGWKHHAFNAVSKISMRATEYATVPKGSRTRPRVGN